MTLDMGAVTLDRGSVALDREAVFLLTDQVSDAVEEGSLVYG